ncbi:ComEA family DNA-binding protein [Benzoatithermus flavus]|uniref:Helix-hairpin-helix domain-containing protein n=1 Tax=Benzoatithermus flavus TaxID=3108223 RepID=A0ABU8XMQ1_9PROT
MGKSKKSSKGSGLRTAVDLAAAGIGLASMAYDAYFEHRACQDGLSDGDGRQQEPARTVAGDRLPGAAGAAARAIRREAAGSGEPPKQSAGEPETGMLGRTLGAVGAVTGLAEALIDLNRASPDMLMSLRKIGKKRARKIVAHRPFGRIKDLKKVLPKRVYKAVKQHLTV